MLSQGSEQPYERVGFIFFPLNILDNWGPHVGYKGDFFWVQGTIGYERGVIQGQVKCIQ
jgi:hypothetical protein